MVPWEEWPKALAKVVTIFISWSIMEKRLSYLNQMGVEIWNWQPNQGISADYLSRSRKAIFIDFRPEKIPAFIPGKPYKISMWVQVSICATLFDNGNKIVMAPPKVLFFRRGHLFDKLPWPRI